MKAVFRGWKRKVGIASLVLACAVCGVWLRSLDSMDLIFVSLGDQQFELTSHVNGVVLNCSARPDVLLLEHSFGFLSYCWITISSPSTYKLQGLTIPYWSIALPLALLSAWLVLSKTSNDPSESGGGMHQD